MKKIIAKRMKNRNLEQFGDFLVLKNEPTPEDYEKVVSRTMKFMLDIISNVREDKVWELEEASFIKKDKNELPENVYPEDVIGTLGFKIAIRWFDREGEADDNC